MGYIFITCALRARAIPMYMCLIDLQKAYDSVNRELLWVVPARSGIPEKMLTIIRQFHIGMRARVRANDGEQSEPFDTTHRDCAKNEYSRPFSSIYFSPLRFMPSWYASVWTKTF